jgi:hypothetical protein
VLGFGFFYLSRISLFGLKNGSCLEKQKKNEISAKDELQKTSKVL